MSERFKKLKRKYLFGAILKSVICGVSFGLFAVGIILLALKLSAISLGVVWYIVIGVAAAVIGTGVSFVFFKPTNKKVATRLDNEFSLEERVQTSLEFSGQEGVLLGLQRADTEQKLSNLPKSKVRFSRIWQFGVSALIAVAMATTAFVVPAKAAVPTGDDAPAVVGTLPIDQIKKMIDDVQKSKITDTVKTKIEYELRNLISELSVEDLTQGDLKSAVNSAITEVNLAVNNSVSYFEVSDILEAEETVFGQIILRGGNAYRVYQPAGATTIKTYDHVELFDSEKQSRTLNRMDAGKNAILKSLDIKIGEGWSEWSDAMTLIIDPLNSGIEALSEEFAEDSLYSYLVIFKDKFAALQEKVELGEFTSDDDLQAEIKNMFIGEDWESLALELSVQSYAGAVRRFVGNRLKDIFGLGGLELPDRDDDVGGNNGGTNNPDNPDPGEGDPGNGVIGGDPGYGDKEVYDPFTGKYVEYGKLLSQYHAMYIELREKGLLTDEQIKMAEDFFGKLYGSDKNE
ncbi:MAG: magnesium transporter [Clostridiales bacterium]|nr:magnesium transporter [Clostridiales bacterium]